MHQRAAPCGKAQRFQEATQSIPWPAHKVVGVAAVCKEAHWAHEAPRVGCRGREAVGVLRIQRVQWGQWGRQECSCTPAAVVARPARFDTSAGRTVHHPALAWVALPLELLPASYQQSLSSASRNNPNTKKTETGSLTRVALPLELLPVSQRLQRQAAAKQQQAGDQGGAPSEAAGGGVGACQGVG